MRDFFVDIKEVKAGDHRVYMGNNTYCDVLDIGTVKIMILGERNLYLSGVLFFFFFLLLKNENFIQTATGIELKSLNQTSSTRGGRFLGKKTTGSSN